jgi:hypothetical protein
MYSIFMIFLKLSWSFMLKTLQFGKSLNLTSKK